MFPELEDRKTAIANTRILIQALRDGNEEAVPIARTVLRGIMVAKGREDGLHLVATMLPDIMANGIEAATNDLQHIVERLESAQHN